MIKVVHGGVGAINESDVILASASNAIIIGFNVRPDNTAKEIADREKVDLRLVFEPEWNQDMMSEEAKLELGFL